MLPFPKSDIGVSWVYHTHGLRRSNLVRFVACSFYFRYDQEMGKANFNVTFTYQLWPQEQRRKRDDHVMTNRSMRYKLFSHHATTVYAGGFIFYPVLLLHVDIPKLGVVSRGGGGGRIRQNERDRKVESLHLLDSSGRRLGGPH